MKKKLIYIAFFIGALICLGSCYNDNGNYDYTSLPDVKITTDKDTYVATQFQTLEIPVNIDFAGDSEADYEYTWRLWSNEIKRSDYKKVISNQKDLSFPVDELAGSYTLVFTCHNKKTNVDTYKNMVLTVQGSITEGWMVLHEKNGVTDFDLIKTPFFSSRVDKDEVLHNVYAMNGEQLEGRGVKIGSYIDTQRQYVTILTDKGGAKLEATTMQKAFDMSTLMVDGKTWKPENYIYYSYRGTARAQGYDVIVNDGRVYFYNVFGSNNYTSYTEPIKKDGLTYRASKYMPRYIWGSYYGMGIVIYDDLNGRFLYVDKSFKFTTMPDATGCPFDWNNMHGKLVYMETGFNNHDLGLIEDWDSHKKTLYEFNFDEKKLAKAILKKYPIGDCPEMDDAKYYAIGERGPVFYYATDKKVYLYDYTGTNTAKEAYALSNANEKITGMKILKPNVSFSRTVKLEHAYSNKVLILSTYNESTKEGKVYMYYINESNGTIDRSSEHVITGFGEILDMDFNWAKYGS